MKPFPRIPHPFLRQASALPQVLFGLLAIPSLLLAQAPAPSGARLPETVVTAKAIGRETDSVLPTATPNNSAYGFDRSIMDTPRSVTAIQSSELEDNNIRTISDLTRSASSTFGPTVFGIQSLPYIRGQEGEIFQNGMRRGPGNNGYGLPLSFNSVEALDVVKGPATPVFGPTQRVGGFINLITKRAPLDRLTGMIWGSGGTFDKYRGTFDLGVPIIKDELGLRLSYEKVEEDSFYRNVRFQSDSVYLALDWKPSDTFRLDFNAEYYRADFSDNAGINRPTNDLIRNGIYITGRGVSPITGTVPGPFSVVSPTGEKRIDRSNVLVDPEDVSSANTFIAQLAATWKLTDNLKAVNRTYFQTAEKETIAQNSFREILDENYTVENRTELIWNWDIPYGSAPPGLSKDGTSKVVLEPEAIENTTVGGFDFRWNHAKGYSQFNTEADNAVDLTENLRNQRVPRDVVLNILQPGNVFTASGYGNLLLSSGGNYDTNGDGLVDVFANGDVNETDSFQYGLFLEHDVKFNDWMSLIIGGRGDLVHVTTSDPLPPPGQEAVEDSITFGQGAGNASLLIKPFKLLTLYATYNFSQSSNSALGGGYALSNNTLPTSSFHIASQLYEGGFKLSLLDEKLFIQGAGFTQSRSIRQRDGSTSKLRVSGAELEATYQPGRNFYAKLTGSYLDARFDNSGTFQATDRVQDVFDNSRPDIIRGTGRGSPNFQPFPPGDYKFPGIPDFMANATLRYKLDCGLGAHLNAVVTSEMNLDAQGNVKIPNQITVNAGIFYEQPRWEVAVDVFNLTDEKNWTTVFNGYFGADLVLPEEPVRALASVRIRF